MLFNILILKLPPSLARQRLTMPIKKTLAYKI